MGVNLCAIFKILSRCFSMSIPTCKSSEIIIAVNVKECVMEINFPFFKWGFPNSSYTKSSSVYSTSFNKCLILKNPF